MNSRGTDTRKLTTLLLLKALLVVAILCAIQLEAVPSVYGQSPSCTDSDGGLAYSEAGYVEGIGPNGWPYIKYDECQTGDSEGQIKEFWCNGTMPWPQFYECPNGCADGACVPETCTDDDDDGYAVEGGGCGLVDCDDGDPNVNPGADEVCDNGIDDDCNGLIDGDDPACVVCTDGDGDGYAVEGGACGAVDCDDTDPDVNPGEDEICDNGIDDDCDGLIDDDDSDCGGLTCFDSDGGLTFDVAGYVSGYSFNGYPQTKYDVCETGNYEGYVREYYCDGLTPWPKFYPCPYGCVDGACSIWPPGCTDADGDGFAAEGGDCGDVDCDDSDPAVNPDAAEVCDNSVDDDCNGLVDAQDPACFPCTDSDGGLTYFVQGTVVDQGGTSFVDECTATPGELREYYCDDSFNVQYELYPCQTSCVDGACYAKNTIVIGWDGAQRDHFLECYNQQLPECPDGLPNLAQLAGGAIWGSTITSGGTCTKPGWAQILSGYNAEVMGIYDLTNYQPLPEGYTIMEKIENYFGPDNVVTMFVSGKGEHTGGACIGDLTLKQGQWVIEDKGQPYCFTKFNLDYFELDLNQNDLIANRAMQLLETHQDDLFFAFFLWRDPDVTGHMFGENSVEYSEKMVEVDYWLGQIVAKLQDLGIYDKTLIYVITDHGFDEGQSVHLNAPYGFMASNDPLVMRSGDRKDLAPTILERYGINVGPIGDAPAVDGYSLLSIPPIGCVAEGGGYIDYAGAPTCCNDLTLIGLDKKYGLCKPPTGGTGDNSGYCTACGDGLCTEPESVCTCPQDCPY
jgi:hypothetical protein